MIEACIIRNVPHNSSEMNRLRMALSYTCIIAPSYLNTPKASSVLDELLLTLFMSQFSTVYTSEHWFIVYIPLIPSASPTSYRSSPGMETAYIGGGGDGW